MIIQHLFWGEGSVAQLGIHTANEAVGYNERNIHWLDRRSLKTSGVRCKCKRNPINKIPEERVVFPSDKKS